jgi:hypothetical protein
MPQDHPDEPEALVQGTRQTPNPNEPKGCFLGKGPRAPRQRPTQTALLNGRPGPIRRCQDSRRNRVRDQTDAGRNDDHPSIAGLPGRWAAADEPAA